MSLKKPKAARREFAGPEDQGVVDPAAEARREFRKEYT